MDRNQRVSVDELFHSYSEDKKFFLLDDKRGKMLIKCGRPIKPQIVKYLGLSSHGLKKESRIPTTSGMVFHSDFVIEVKDNEGVH